LLLQIADSKAAVALVSNFYTAGDRTSRLRYFRRGIEPSPGRDHTNSDNLARLQVSVLQNAQTIAFFMVRRGQAWSKLAFAAIDFNDRS